VEVPVHLAPDAAVAIATERADFALLVEER